MTLLEKLHTISNDYSKLEQEFLHKTNRDLLTEKPFPVSVQKSVSVIIPAYKSHKVLERVLQAIAHQTFLKHGGNLEVIIVDDASPTPLLTVIQKFETDLRIRYIRLSENYGAGYSRDEALSIAKNDLVIFIDSDVVMPEFFISNHVFVHANTRKPIILVSFRENVGVRDTRIHSRLRKQGNRFGGDHRVYMKFKDSWVMRTSQKKYINQEFTLVESTNAFKDFGNGRKVDLWTLPMMVLTCAMSVPRQLVVSASPTPRNLKGWGFNDTCLAVKMMIQGVFVIPNFNSTVLHILEKNHTKPDQQKNKEYLHNERVYRILLNSPL